MSLSVGALLLLPVHETFNNVQLLPAELVCCCNAQQRLVAVPRPRRLCLCLSSNLQEMRASIDTIKAHAWFNKPLPPKYEKALEVRGAAARRA